MVSELAAVSGQVTLGNLFTLLGVLAVGAAGYYKLRGVHRDTLEETSNFWREQVDPLKQIVDELRTQNERLMAERDEQREMKHGLRAELEAERKTRDLAPIVQALVEQSAALTRFEVSISERLDANVHAQKATSEVLQGLVLNVADLNRTIRER